MLENILYRGKIGFIMGKKKEKKKKDINVPESEVVKSHIDNEINKKNILSKFLSNQIVISVLSPLILALVLCLVGTAQGFLELPGKINKIETSVNNLQCRPTCIQDILCL